MWHNKEYASLCLPVPNKVSSSYLLRICSVQRYP